MVITTLLHIVTGLLVAPLLARAIHRRWDVPWRLLLPGVLAGLVAQIGGGFVQSAVARSILGSPESLALPIFAALLGMGLGLLAILLLVMALGWLAPTARTFPTVAMVGVGYGGAELVVRAVLAALLLIATLQIASTPAEDWDLPPAEAATQQANLDAYFSTPASGPLLDAVSALGKLAHGVAVAVLVGTMFLTGQVGWAFAGWFWAGFATIGAVLFGGGAAVVLATWWVVIGAASVWLVIRQARRRWPVGLQA